MSGFNFTKELLEDKRHELTARYSYIINNPNTIQDPNESGILATQISELNNAITVLEGHYEYIQTPG